jgi:hypothetical protein
MEESGLEREQGLKKFLELPNGIPGGSTFFRVFKRVKPEEPGLSLYEWLAGMRDGLLTVMIRVSGKGEHNAAHVVSAWTGGEETVPGQVAVDEKSSGIRAVLRLPGLPGIKIVVVTAGATGCWRETAAKIRTKEADYLLAVKDTTPDCTGISANILMGRKRKRSWPKKRFSAAMRPGCMFTALFGK